MSILRIHFLNVGHGDCIIVEFPNGNLTMIDINRTSSLDISSMAEILNQQNAGYLMEMEKTALSQGRLSFNQLLEKAGYAITLTDPIQYMQSEFPGYGLFRFISTHPHLDHLTGLSSLKSGIGFINFWVTNHSFVPDKLNEATDQQVLDWSLYSNLKNGTQDGVTVVKPLEGAENDFWKQDGIKILAPNPVILNAASKHNDLSYVLLIQFGHSKILLGGDAEKLTWDYLFERYPSTLSNIAILKASHHGRDSGYHQEAVKLMNPGYTIVSVGQKPESDATNKYRKNTRIGVYSTRWKGNIVFDVLENGEAYPFPQYDR